MIRDAVIGEDGDIVGWFELTDARGLRKDSPCSGEARMGHKRRHTAPPLELPNTLVPAHPQLDFGCVSGGV